MTRDQTEWLSEQFEATRPQLRSVAYRMLGSRTEAEDAVQEAWLKAARGDTGAVDNIEAWLTTIVARTCLDRLRARRARPEDPADFVGRPPMAEDGDDQADPERAAVLADSIGTALLVVLDQLAPAERVAFVLHDVFAVPFDDVAEVVGKSPAAARQLASRARRRVQGASATTAIDLVRQREIVEAFLAAAQGGDFDALVAVLDPDVRLEPDEAALAMGSLRLTDGAERVASALAGGARAARIALIDGVAGLIWAPGDEVRGVVEFTVRDGLVVQLHVTGDPDHIARLDIVPVSN